MNTRKGSAKQHSLLLYLYGLLPIFWFLIHQVMLIYVSLGFRTRLLLGCLLFQMAAQTSSLLESPQMNIHGYKQKCDRH